MTVPLISRLRWMIAALFMCGVLLSVGAQGDPLTLPDEVPTLEPTPGALPEGEWRGFTDPSSDSLGLPVEQSGETRQWRGSRAPSAADDVTVSTRGQDPAGSDATEAFDFTGAFPWHRAGYTGGGSTPIRIALIDFGFGASETIPNARKPELTCLSSHPNVAFASGFGTPTAGDTGRGLDMAEVICDLVPDSVVTLYRVKTSARLYDAIAAADNNNNIIVIGTDFGASFSPGDGTFGRTDAKNVYTALADARNAGVVVIAAAGNANQSYKSFTYTGGTSNLSVTAKPGDTIDISWSDWDSSQAGGGTREDISASLTGAGFSAQAKPSRSGGLPAYQWTVPSCTTDGNGFCTSMTLGLTGLSGDASSVVVQVSVSGIGRALGNPSAGTLLSLSGTLSRPADSPDVITVGAVCADRDNNFPVMNYSGRGPIFASGGRAPTAPGGSYLTANVVKPDTASFAHVSVTNASVNDLRNCNEGFGGTQAATAHLAGMVALMRQNPVNSAFRGTNPQPNILTYLRTHAIDLPLTAPDGYDYQTGAGVAVLGRPSYDNDPQFGTIPLFGTPDNLPAGACTGSDASIDAGDILYVGPYNVGAAGMNGSISAPFTSLAQAARLQVHSSANKCVIVLPGETVTPFLFTGVDGVKVFAYNSITSGDFSSSEIFVNNVINGRIDPNFRVRRAGIVVEDMPNWYWSGFSFRGSVSFNTSLQPRPQAVALDNADHATFTDNVVTDFPELQAVTLIEVFNEAAPVTISYNSFIDITGSSLPGIVGVSDSGSDLQYVTIANNLFNAIENASGSWSFVTNPQAVSPSITVFFTPIVFTLDSYTLIQSNTFTNNTSETLIQFMTRQKDSPYQTGILGNVILNNTIRTYDALDNAGPLINGFFGKRIFILNNTIVNNKLLTSGNYALLFGRGDADPDDAINGIEWNGSLNSTQARWEIRNNLIYNNGSVPLVGDTDPKFEGSGCSSVLGDTNNSHDGAQRNWLYNLNNAMNAGQCSLSVSNLSHGNITINPYLTVDGVPVEGQTYIFGGDDPTSLLYYTLTGNEANLTADGVDEGDDAIITSLFPSFANGRDARNAGRRRDGDGNDSIVIDIGALELSGADLSFLLTTPANNAVLTTVSAGFTWEPAADAISYTFDIKRIEDNSPINLFTLNGLTPAADADGLTCSVGCLLTLTPAQQTLIDDTGGLFRWTVTANDAENSELAGNAPRNFTIPTGTPIPINNAGFETAGKTAKQAQGWKTNKKQGDDIRKCGAGFGGNGSNCSFQLRAKSGTAANAVKQKLTSGLGDGGDTLTLSAYVRRKGLVANTATIVAKITYAPKNTATLKIILPAGGSDTWEATPYSNSIVLSASPTAIMVSATIKGKKGTYWVDDISLLLE